MYKERGKRKKDKNDEGEVVKKGRKKKGRDDQKGCENKLTRSYHSVMLALKRTRLTANHSF